MKERPILMSSPMVRSTLDDTKSQTRRSVNRIATLGRVTEFQCSDTPGFDWVARDKKMRWNEMSHAELLEMCPYGLPGDRLWVRETWAPNNVQPIEHRPPVEFLYAATDSKRYAVCRWRPSIHMPRAASRITLEVTDVRVERLQDISETDARAEGIEQVPLTSLDAPGVPRWKVYRDPPTSAGSPVASYRSLWESINGPGSWGANPWVWVVSFRRLP